MRPPLFLHTVYYPINNLLITVWPPRSFEPSLDSVLWRLVCLWIRDLWKILEMFTFFHQIALRGTTFWELPCGDPQIGDFFMNRCRSLHSMPYLIVW
jgi:hypothetical protein